MRPATEWLEGSGLTVDNGVVCDRSLFCADAVVAIGDLAHFEWHHAWAPMPSGSSTGR